MSLSYCSCVQIVIVNELCQLLESPQTSLQISLRTLRALSIGNVSAQVAALCHDSNDAKAEQLLKDVMDSIAEKRSNVACYLIVDRVRVPVRIRSPVYIIPRPLVC